MYQRQLEKQADETTSAKVANKPAQVTPSRAPTWTNAQGNQPPITLQPKLTVNQPGDEYEQEADHVAAQVMRTTTPSVTQVQRCACGGIAGTDGECAACKAKRLDLQRKADGTAYTEAPPSVHETLRSSGQPLDVSTRAFMEPRFGADFSNVRVHTNSQAAQSAADVAAHAYTVGQNVVFAAGEYSPNMNTGKELLAHELAHVTQQNGSARHVARAPVTEYGTSAIQFERSDIEKMVGVSYWEQKIAEKYAITYINPVKSRFGADIEERDAVLSTLWQRKPTVPVKTDTIVNVSIPQRQNNPKSKPILYQFTFTPAPQGGKEGIRIDFKIEDSTATVAATPPAVYTPPILSRDASGFSDGIDKYFKDHPDEHKQLYYWIENASGQKFDQFVTSSETVKGKKHDSTYHVKGTKNATGKLTSLDINLLSETPTYIDNPPLGYAGKDRTDLELEKAQAKTSDKLGKINNLNSLPPDEQLSVKYVISQYFESGTRNKEVDVIIPIANKRTRVFYTLRFQSGTNDVDIERVGEEDSNTKLTAAALNIGRVEGFAANSSNEAAFTAWISKRYPSITPKGTNLAELQDSVNKQMVAGANTPAWFKANYGIEILDATAAETRLQTVHNRSSAETVDLKTFSSDDLKHLEFALETMSNAELQIVKSTQMGRQDILIELKGKTKTPTPDSKTAGVTWQSGSEKTIIIFDSATSNDQQLFIGGSGGVRSSNVQIYAHEFGHILNTQAALEAPFKEFVKKKGIKPMTKYAASKPATETFPEAFALFQTDPEWMQNNLPDLFTWFDTVKKTGKPPVKP